MSKSIDLIDARKPSPMTSAAIYVLGIRSANGKSQIIDRFLSTKPDEFHPHIQKLTLIDDNFAFCHTYFPVILLMQVKSCNNVANS